MFITLRTTFISLFFLQGHAGADTAPDLPKLSPICYFHQFDIRQFPWKMGDCLNYEEVFKNFQYDEVRYDREGRSLTVLRFENGKKKSIAHHKLN